MSFVVARLLGSGVKQYRISERAPMILIKLNNRKLRKQKQADREREKCLVLHQLFASKHAQA